MKKDEDMIVLDIGLKDIIVNFIDVVTSRGAIRGDELEMVGFIRRSVLTAENLKNYKAQKEDLEKQEQQLSSK